MNCASSFSQWCGLSCSSVIGHQIKRSSRSPDHEITRSTDSEALPKPLLKLLAVASAQCKPGAVLQHHHIFTVEPRLHFLDAVGVDDAGAVDADEPLGVEPAL